ncbi:MAG: HAD hydrolase-like protein [Microbacteriaceae bacterium]
MTSPFTCILFDLDGTIVDSAPGITATLRFTFDKLGFEPLSPEQQMAFVGPPILDSFRDIAGLTPEESAEALDVYREKYLDDGAYDATAFSGVGGVLKKIHASPLLMSLATSKPELPATLILEHFNLARYFDVITGASADEVRSAKADVVGEALVRLDALGADLSRPVLVGDRIHDTEGAAAHGVPTILVGWGYGTEAEHQGALDVVATPLELQRRLLGPA